MLLRDLAQELEKNEFKFSVQQRRETAESRQFVKYPPGGKTLPQKPLSFTVDKSGHGMYIGLGVWASGLSLNTRKENNGVPRKFL